MYEKAKIVTMGMLDLVMVLAGCESNDNRLTVLRKVVECLVYHSDSKYLHQRLLPAIQQLSESE